MTIYEVGWLVDIVIAGHKVNQIPAHITGVNESTYTVFYDSAVGTKEETYPKEEIRQSARAVLDGEGSNLEAAVFYAMAGWSIIPLQWIEEDGSCSCGSKDCTSGGKHPIGELAPNGVNHLTKNIDTIKSWWRRCPKANIGISSANLVIDIDQGENKSGFEEIEHLQEQYSTLPETPTQTTGSGGRHLVFSSPMDLQTGVGKLTDSIDIKGGLRKYIVAAPSIHPSGNRYHWEELLPESENIAPMPSWMVEILRSRKRQGEVQVSFDKSISKGVELREFDLPEEIQQLVSSGPGRDRSKADAKVVTTLVNRQATDSEILWVYQNNPIGTQGKFADPKHGIEYLKRTIASARAFTGIVNPRPRYSHLLEQTETIDVLEPAEAEQRAVEIAGSSGHLNKTEWSLLREKLGKYTRKSLLDNVHQKERQEATKVLVGRSSYPYVVKEGSTFLVDDYGNLREVCSFTAYVAEEHNTDDGLIRIIKGHGGRSKRPFKAEIEAADMGDPRAMSRILRSSIGGVDWIAANMGAHLDPMITKQTTTPPRQIRRYSNLGWHNGRFVIPGNIDGSEAIEGVTGIFYDVSGEESMGIALQTLDSLIQSVGPEKAVPVISSVFQAPLLRAVGLEDDRYALMVTGRTGSFKTAFCKVAMCVFGRHFAEDASLVNFGTGATMNALIALAAMANDLPLFVDNYKPVMLRGGSDALISLIHTMLQGGEKRRLRRNSSLMENRPLYNGLLINGEDIPDGDPAMLARVLRIHFDRPTPIKEEKLTEAQAGAHTLPMLGKTWLHHLQSSSGRLREIKESTFGMYRSRWLEKVESGGGRPVNSLRTASNIAVNEFTWHMLCDHPLIGQVAKNYLDVYEVDFDQIAREHATMTTQSTEASRFVEVLMTLLDTGRVRTLSKDVPSVWDNEPGSGVVIGHHDSSGEVLYLPPTVAIEAVSRFDDLGGVSTTTLGKQLLEEGYLLDSAGSRTTKLIRVGEQVMRVWVLHRVRSDAWTAAYGLQDGLDL